MASSVTGAPKALVLLGGGVDSVTALYYVVAAGYDVSALTFLYGQKHRSEVDLASYHARHLKVSHTVVELPRIGGSALTGDGEVEKDLDPCRDGDALSSYVPGRNLLMISHAASMLDALGGGVIVGGLNTVDYQGFPDSSQDFLDVVNAALYEGLRNSVVVLMPFLHFKKAQIIRLGTRLGVKFQYTLSCFDPVLQPELTSAIIADRACGRCDACQIRRDAFAQAGCNDLTDYAR